MPEIKYLSSIPEMSETTLQEHNDETTTNYTQRLYEFDPQGDQAGNESNTSTTRSDDTHYTKQDDLKKKIVSDRMDAYLRLTGKIDVGPDDLLSIKQDRGKKVPKYET